MFRSVAPVIGGLLILVALFRAFSRARNSSMTSEQEIMFLAAARLVAGLAAALYLAMVSHTLQTLFYVPIVALSVLLLALSLDWQRALIKDWLRRRRSDLGRKGLLWLILRGVPYLGLLAMAVVLFSACADRPLYDIAAGFVIGIAISPIGWWFSAQQESTD